MRGTRAGRVPRFPGASTRSCILEVGYETASADLAVDPCALRRNAAAPCHTQPGWASGRREGLQRGRGRTGILVGPSISLLLVSAALLLSAARGRAAATGLRAAGASAGASLGLVLLQKCRRILPTDSKLPGTLDTGSAEESVRGKMARARGFRGGTASAPGNAYGAGSSAQNKDDIGDVQWMYEKGNQVLVPQGSKLAYTPAVTPPP